MAGQLHTAADGTPARAATGLGKAVQRQPSAQSGPYRLKRIILVSLDSRLAARWGFFLKTKRRRYTEQITNAREPSTTLLCPAAATRPAVIKEQRALQTGLEPQERDPKCPLHGAAEETLVRGAGMCDAASVPAHLDAVLVDSTAV
jgi:hypothetical protein